MIGTLKLTATAPGQNGKPEGVIMLGSEREIRGQFLLDDGSPIDPPVCTFMMREQDGTLTTYRYTEHPELERLDVGLFRVLWKTRSAGLHAYRFSCFEQDLKIAGEDDFWVQYSSVNSVSSRND